MLPEKSNKSTYSVGDVCPIKVDVKLFSSHGKETSLMAGTKASFLHL